MQYHSIQEYPSHINMLLRKIFCSPEPPGPPGLPDVVDFDENMVKLKWDPPIRDNGAPITGYIIEMKPKNGTVSIPHLKVSCHVFITATGLGNEHLR